MSQSPPKARIYLENNPKVERLVPELAAVIGLNESIMLLQIDFWIGSSNNFEDGQYWTYQSVRDMQKKAFPYWSIATITRIIVNLEAEKLITVGNFNKRKGDTTRWFALNVDGLKKLGEKVACIKVIQGVFQNETPITQNETTLPENTTDIKDKDSAPQADAVPVLEVVKPKQRTPDPIFDAVTLHIFEIEDVNTEGGRIGKISNWLSGKYAGKGVERVGKISKPAEVEHILQFADHCKRKGINPPLDFVKFVENWRKWATALKQKAAAPAWIPVTPAAAEPSTPALSAEQRAAMLAQSRQRRGALVGQMTTNTDMEEAS